MGGIKEKVLAAHRAGLSRVILPAANQKDLHDIPGDVQVSITVGWHNHQSCLSDIHNPITQTLSHMCKHQMDKYNHRCA